MPELELRFPRPPGGSWIRWGVRAAVLLRTGLRFIAGCAPRSSHLGAEHSLPGRASLLLHAGEMLNIHLQSEERE